MLCFMKFFTQEILSAWNLASSHFRARIQCEDTAIYTEKEKIKLKLEKTQDKATFYFYSFAKYTREKHF